MFKIIGVKHDNKGEIVAYKLDNGKIVTKDEGVNIAKKGEIEGVTVGVSKKGEEFLRSVPDGKDINNLDNLPEVR
ncbi:Protein of unknown function [Caloramator quimbayensis]|uniref:DUF3892 domain-containing protein n=1 Tax=Caloramator quimbayensis TaxID=1147123 RepID=A0A1T4YGL1_9CLOT|nr:DUF3892 domain-containing protein [Caloramator quimbayensis]SKB00718.1 Protein of unknown function [Caloramator quimbayensis]